jgi:hypothetical protein
MLLCSAVHVPFWYGQGDGIAITFHGYLNQLPVIGKIIQYILALNMDLRRYLQISVFKRYQPKGLTVLKFRPILTSKRIQIFFHFWKIIYTYFDPYF